MHYPGDYNILVPGHRDIEYRQRVLDEHGVDTQVLTFTTPGVHVEPPAVAVRLARQINDAFARVMRGTARAGSPRSRRCRSTIRPRRSSELERAMKELGLPGAMVFSNVNHVALADERFAPLWKKADELGAVIYIHPTDPAGVEAMLDYWLMPLVGFLMDTTLAASKLVFSGVVERHPRIRWVLTHMGGAIPYLAERLDRGLPRVRRLPPAHQPAAERIPEDASTTTRSTSTRTPCEFAIELRRRGSHPRRQRLSPPDRQHPADDRDR